MLNSNNSQSYFGLNPLQRQILEMFNNPTQNGNPGTMSFYNYQMPFTTQIQDFVKLAEAAKGWNSSIGDTDEKDIGEKDADKDNKKGNSWLKTGAGKLGLLSGAMNFINSMTGDFINSQMHSANESTYRSQARLALRNIEAKNAYLNEQGAQQIWNLADQKAQFKSSQMTAWATSGFSDISAGDRRIIDDTDRKYSAAAAGIRRSMFLQNFENWRSGMMEYSRLQYAAQASERMAKASISPFKIAGNLGNAILNGMGTYAALGGSFKKIKPGKDVKSV